MNLLVSVSEPAEVMLLSTSQYILIRAVLGYFRGWIS